MREEGKFATLEWDSMNQPDSLKNGRKKSEMAEKEEKRETRNEVGFSTPSPKHTVVCRFVVHRSNEERRIFTIF